MRALLLVILGLAVGAMGATFALSALRQGTPFHSGVMAVMQHHMGALRANVRAKQCDAKGNASHLARMRETAGDIRDAFPEMEASFFQVDDTLLTALDGAVAAAPTTCEALVAALKPVGDACQSCHQQFR
ncbi:cytochrome c556 [Luteibacter sp. OK325]|jgi:cytochrome c556|uniref:cytochrome c n=1 Tax=Luteibacter sp. OK325 TaxID=2135670 RepID=UPI000D354BC6|nr:cytochrome c [Luteibacter sp. OK325]PTR24677.1 cytochrome c556 [Luteibacter sp. OK325]